MQKLLDKVATYFYLNIFNGHVPDTRELKNKWDSICRVNADYIDAKRNLDGWGLIVNLVNWAHRNEIFVLDVNTQYNLVVDDNEIVGQMAPFIATPNGKIELLNSHFSTRVPEQIDVDMKLKYTIDMLAFSRIYGKELDGVHIKLFKQDKDMYSRRTTIDFRRLESTITGVCKGIEAGVYYPRESPLCSTCNAKQYCKFWCKNGQ